MLAGHAGIFTLLAFAFLTGGIIFFFILLVMLPTCAGIIFAIFAAYAVGLLAINTSVLTGDFFAGVAITWAEAFQYCTNFAAFT